MTGHCLRCLVGFGAALALVTCARDSTNLVGKACDAVHSCAEGLICKPDPHGNGGVCVKTTCDSALDCGDGFACHDHRCVAEIGSVCQADAECAGSHCVSGGLLRLCVRRRV